MNYHSTVQLRLDRARPMVAGARRPGSADQGPVDDLATTLVVWVMSAGVIGFDCCNCY